MPGKTVHSSQEALAVAIKDWILNCGGFCKKDMIRIINLFKLTRPLQEKHNEKMDEIWKLINKATDEFSPAFDNPESESCSHIEMRYVAKLSVIFGELWSVIHEEEIIPANMIMKSEEMEK